MNTEFSDSRVKKKKAQQGKSAEAEVQAFLKKIDESTVEFDWHRGYDARAAGGKFQRVAGDFSFYWPQGHGIIEVKEIAKGARLPYSNFSESQVGKARKRAMAGGTVIVLIYTKADDVWRRVPIDEFKHRPGPEFGSWDISGYLAFPSVEAASGL